VRHRRGEVAVLRELIRLVPRRLGRPERRHLELLLLLRALERLREVLGVVGDVLSARWDRRSITIMRRCGTDYLHV
jgi:hypothetical protein